MDTSLAARLDRLATRLPRAYPGPGGAIAVLRDGEVLVRHAWGWANAERRIPFTPRTLFRMCSITKQFTCAAGAGCLPRPVGAGRAMCAPACRCWTRRRPARCTCATTSPACATIGRWRCCTARPVEAPFGDAEAARVIAGTAVAALRARHALLLRQPEFPPAVGHLAGPYRPQLRRVAAHPHLRPRRHGQPPSWPPIPAPCRTAPRAMRARRPAASAPRRTASSGPAMPGSAPASTT